MHSLRPLAATLPTALGIGGASAAPAAASMPSRRAGDLRSIGTAALRSSCGAAAQAGIGRATREELVA